MSAALTVLAAFALAGFAATGGVLRILRARKILAPPNARSSHTRPTPRGGGLAVTPLAALGLAWAMSRTGATPGGLAMLAGMAALGLVSWIDDRRNLSPLPRLLVQIAAVAVTLSLMPPLFLPRGLVPPLLEKIVAGIAWVWFVNLYNFMDGIDGIAGVETAAVAVGLMLAGAGRLSPLPYAVVAGTALGFLAWNWHPAKIFLGDVGSIPLGFCLGYLMLDAATALPGGWAIPLILPAYYWADATWTLLRRALEGKKVWQAHREHFYQRAVRGGWSHATVSLAVLLCNAALIGAAVLSVHRRPFAALALAAVAAALTLRLFFLKSRNAGD